MARIICIKKAEFVKSYSIGEYVEKKNYWKEQRSFQSPQEIVDYLSNSNEKYAQELRERKNLGIIVNLPDAEESRSLFVALQEIKPKFKKVNIRSAPSSH